MVLAMNNSNEKRVILATNNKRTKKFILLILVFVFILGSFAGCKFSYKMTDGDKEYYAGSETIFNTPVSISIFDGGSDELMNEAFDLCRTIEADLGARRESGIIADMNSESAASLSPELYFFIPEEYADLITKAQYYNTRTNGAFDITIGAVSKLWDFTSSNPEKPNNDDIQYELNFVGGNNINSSNTGVSFRKAGVELDLGAIAKGFATDKIVELFRSKGVKSAVISLGGNIFCIGNRTDGEPFKIGIQKPFAEYAETVAIMNVSDLSVVSSGIYQRCFTDSDGKFYHHILDPKTGYPVENDLTSVTVVGPCSADCDALSTSLFLLGLDEGMKFIDSLDDYYAVFVTDNYEVIYSEGFLDAISVVDYVAEGNGT